MSVRLRYAPSPTGDPHVGNIRTALWAWLHARRHGGDFIVRLEDTDQSRAVDGSLERILASLRWLGVDWDEGPDIGGPHAPYVQSQRLHRYHAAVEELVGGGAAYRCFCTPEELSALRKQQQAEKRPTGYEGTCRALPSAEVTSRIAGGEASVVRFRMPDDGVTAFTDALRGEISVDNSTQEDFVILKSDGFPTYHLAHVVDDHAMEITHITRGEEWIPSAPRHVRLFEALDYDVPELVHTPVILGPDGGKLSKRHGAKSVLEYAEDGYIAAALLNFLINIGWSLDGETEVVPLEKLLEVFDIHDLGVSPAAFDTTKLEWMNGVYLREMPERLLSELFAVRLERDLPGDVARPLDRAFVEELTPLVRERMKLLSELAPMVDFFFATDIATPDSGALLGKRYRKRPDVARGLLAAAADGIEGIEGWAVELIESRLRELAAELEEKPGDLFMLCRLAVTGKPVTPPLFETMEIVGPERCVERLRAAASSLDSVATEA
ncbi:MAG: glutamate--tRNA ligase [Dehalococcoidia bacterium]|nr:glutamate--tRNA ligase [Dehalococcoidia bacterium]